MTKLTNEELLDAYDAATVDDYPGADIDKIATLRAEILQRMAEGAAGEAAPQGDKWVSLVGPVEHKRDGVWRLHLDMNISTIEAQSILAMQELRRQWPAAEWRVASYVPEAKFFAAASAENTLLVTHRCPKCGTDNFHRTVQTVRCFGCLTDFDIEGVAVKEEA